MSDLVKVLVVVRRGNLQPGDTTGLPPDEAAKAVAAGLVQYAEKPAAPPSAPPVDKAMKAAPKAKAAKKTAKKKASSKKKK